ncbi:MAG: aminoglycoside phosphotransferase family protein [Tropicimonas sp.]|uniref:aminoglycoside phosphotransferase family protein n=1 Tax=Tropicimonas sp. TaxID=2067044 RepID=UPI003A87B984
MTDLPNPPASLLTVLGVSSPVPVADTTIARVWKVVKADGGYAALKCYKNRDCGGEIPGIAFLRTLDGEAAARICGQGAGSVLVEWLDGPSLGDLSRGGRDDEASRELVTVAARLHRIPRGVPMALPSLSEWFASLFEMRFASGCGSELRHDIGRSRQIARHLLATMTGIVPLHGDLHHDNIRHGERGWCAFDAKGVLGERAYELANAFRNPDGVDDLMRDPARIRRLARSWSAAFEVEETRLLQWAAAHCALSISWRHPVLDSDGDADLLHILLAVLDSTLPPQPSRSRRATRGAK